MDMLCHSLPLTGLGIFLPQSIAHFRLLDVKYTKRIYDIVSPVNLDDRRAYEGMPKIMSETSLLQNF